MGKKIFGALLVLLLTLSYTTPAFSQEGQKKEAKATAMKEAGPVKEVACDPSCGFRIQSRDEKEIIAITKKHVKSHHNKSLTDADVKGMMKEVK
jgi:predicted small metal-binding protein